MFNCFKPKKAYLALDPAREPSGLLSSVYIVALGLIAILAFGSHMIIMQMTKAQKERSELVYIAGRQRVTVQQIALHASNFMAHHNQSEKQLMENAYFSFKLGHEYLVKDRAEQGGSGVERSKELREIYFEEPVNLNQQAEEFLVLAEKFMALKDDAPRKDFEDIYVQLYEKATGPLIKGLEIAAQQFQQESIGKINHLANIQTRVFTGLILMIFLEALFIFLPLAFHVKQYSQDLISQALKDLLTGLYNRRAFMQLAEAKISYAKRHNIPLCVVLSDIDKFKAVNDTYGHAAGDAVLQHLAKIITKAIRKEDLVGRIGGEEFAFVLPATKAEQAMRLMNRLRQIIEKTPCQCEDNEGNALALKVTSSFGIALMPNTGETLQSMMMRADKALYEAKEQGRNKVIMALNDKNAGLKVVQKAKTSDS